MYTKIMAHPPLLLAVANACHRDMDPSMRAEVMHRIVAKLKDPPRYIAAASASHVGTVNFAMGVLDYLESQLLPVGQTKEHIARQMPPTQSMLSCVGLCLLCCFILLAIGTE